MISFSNIGEVLAAGKTPMQLVNVLKERISKLYTLDSEYPCDVQIIAYKSKLLYVFGQVSRPGAKICTGRDTLLNVISEARPTILAENTKIRVIRPSTQEGHAKIFELDFKSMSREGSLYQNVLLEEGDIVYVPPTILAGIALTVEEFVRPTGRAFGTFNIVQGP